MLETPLVKNFVDLISQGKSAAEALGELRISGTSQYVTQCQSLMEGLSRSLAQAGNSAAAPDRINAISKLGQLNPQLAETARRSLQSLGNIGGTYAQEAIAQLRNLGGQGVQTVRGLEQLARGSTGGAQQAMEELNFLARHSQAAREALQRLAQVGGQVGNTARQYLTQLTAMGSAAVQAGGATVSTVTLGALAVGAAALVCTAGIGGYVWSQWPEWTQLQPTQLGSRDPSLHPDSIVGSRRMEQPAAAAGQYQVVKLAGAGHGGNGIYSVRSVEELQRGIPWCSFRHGGNSGDPAAWTVVAGPCSLDAAKQALAAKIKSGTMRKPPLAGGLIGEVDGSHVTIDDWGAVDAFEVMGLVNK